MTAGKAGWGDGKVRLYLKLLRHQTWIINSVLLKLLDALHVDPIHLLKVGGHLHALHDLVGLHRLQDFVQVGGGGT